MAYLAGLNSLALGAKDLSGLGVDGYPAKSPMPTGYATKNDIEALKRQLDDLERNFMERLKSLREELMA